MDHTCIICKTQPVSDARYVEMGYRHCAAAACVAAWRRDRLYTQFRLDLIPKVGFGISYRTDVAAATMGRSSGRSI